MPRVTLIQVVYNNRKFIEPVFSAMAGQTYKDTDIVAVIAGNDDGSKELIAKKFPQVRIIDPGCNIGFAKGHNLVFAQGASEFYQLVNPDLVMDSDYVEKLLKAFDDPKVGAATGKLLKCDFAGTDNVLPYSLSKTNVLDSTGVVIFKSGRGIDRGQHETDEGQYDNSLEVDAVSGAGCMYRREALEAVRLSKNLLPEPVDSASSPPIHRERSRTVEGTNSCGELSRTIDPSTGPRGQNFEYFDEDFHSYWEDVDLAWRMRNAGYKCAYVPSAVAYHGRGAGSSKGGYKQVFSYVEFHSKLNPRIRQLNYQNHIFIYIKNSRRFYPQFFIRELAMLAYIILFEIGTLKVVPQMLKLLPKMWRKRKYIQLNINSGQKGYSTGDIIK